MPFPGGNLLKMLLGATFDWFDDDDYDEEQKGGHDDIKKS